MDWVEKFNRLKKEWGLNTTAIEANAGWKEGTLHAALSQGSIPGADRAVRLARATRVSADWLFDDKQEWPPRPIYTWVEECLAGAISFRGGVGTPEDAARARKAASQADDEAQQESAG